MNVQEDATVLIDFSKYQKMYLANKANSSNNATTDVCIGMENATYHKCSAKCVLSCRLIPNMSDVAVTPNECENSACMEGCFCKVGFVRYEDKCVLPKDCPVRINKSIEFNTEVPKRVVKPSCGNGCKPPPCKPPTCKRNSNNFIQESLQKFEIKKLIGYFQVPRWIVLITMKKLPKE